MEMEQDRTEGKSFDGIITDREKEAAQLCIDTALCNGASQVRVSLSKSILDSFSILNGELDKVMHSADRSVYLYIFAEGRYGTFSTNMLEEKSLRDFVSRAAQTTKLLAEDPFRKLPDPGRTAKDAVTGMEAGLYDSSYHEVKPSERLGKALSGAIYNQEPDESVISEECEYSDSIDDNLTIDSQGFEGRHIETSFAYCSEITITGKDGKRYSGYWWDSSPAMADLRTDGCSREALEKARANVGPRRIRSGRYNMVVDRSVSSRLVAPVLSALNGSAIQQNNSFLRDSLGKKIFSGNLSIMDLARTCGCPGSRLYDTEGVATSDGPVVEDGTVKEYFINTYMAGKMGMAPTIEGISRPVLMPFIPDGPVSAAGRSLQSDKKEISLQDVLSICGKGIYVCGFNGGNCNPVTGDFSYGIEGFSFRDGKITGPVREMLVTGNMISLWNNLLAAGSDARRCTRWQIPTLAFEGVDFSA